MYLPGSEAYTFLHDGSMNINSVSLPSGLTFKISRQFAIGFKRTQLFGKDDECLLAIDENNRNQIISSYRPGKTLLKYYLDILHT